MPSKLPRDPYDDAHFGTIACLAPGFAARVEGDYRDRLRECYELHKDQAVPWDEARTNFAPILVIDGTTWRPDSLFDGPAASPTGRFQYAPQTFPAGTALKLHAGRGRRGYVWFTTPIVIPRLIERPPDGGLKLWMSLTPNELISLRAGVKFARGRVVLGGLGLGWLLSRVCQRPVVDDVTVVEKDGELLRWLKPVLCKRYPAVAFKVDRWIEDDVYDFLKARKFQPDTRVLLDIWEDYRAPDRRFWELGRRVEHLWGWGQFASDYEDYR